MFASSQGHPHVPSDLFSKGVSKPEPLGRADAALTDVEQDKVLKMEAHGNAVIPKDKIVLEQLDDDRMLMRGEIAAGTIDVALRCNDNLYRVKDGGFRWINEVSFNR